MSDQSQYDDIYDDYVACLYNSEYLHQLDVPGLIERLRADGGRAPRCLIGECAKRGDEMVDALRVIVETLPHWPRNDGSGECWLIVHGIMILGLISSERAGLLLVHVLALSSSKDDDSILEWFPTGWPALFRNKPVTIEPALIALCRDRQLGWYGRVNGIQALLSLAYERGEQDLLEAMNVVTSIVSDASDDRDVRVHAAGTMLNLPRPQFRIMLERWAIQQEHDTEDRHKFIFDSSNVSAAYKHGTDHPEWLNRPDLWEEIYDSTSLMDRYPPARGPTDPCPCGSGKQYKQCCLVSH